MRPRSIEFKSAAPKGPKSIIVERFLPESCPNCTRRFRRWGQDYHPWEIVQADATKGNLRDVIAASQVGGLHAAVDNILCHFCKNVTARLLLRRDVLDPTITPRTAIDTGGYTAWGLASEATNEGRAIRQVVVVRTRKGIKGRRGMRKSRI